MRPFRRRRAGIALIDLALVLVLVFVAGAAVIKGKDYQKARYRNICYRNQESADALVWKVLYEKKMEVPRLSAGYMLRDADGHGKLILIFLPPPGENAPEEVIVDLTERGYSSDILCPLHREPPPTPAIDYWYAAGRWWCLYDHRHN
ncbi:MAG: hypothetical protein M5R36_29895 [Deltaproteobacteria bacterium]|nr:hypothetical protein [Deltaproteobacteria bacterium]